MGNKRKPPRKVLINETHEPADALPGWPESHVRVELTPDEVDECIEITIHGVRHHLHSTTARALSDELLKRLTEWNAIAHAEGFLGV